MPDIGAISGPWTAFLTGLVVSLHCAGMCGPLAIYLVPRPNEPYSFTTVTAIYHCTRLLAYTLVGAIAGGLGMITLGWVQIYQHSLVRFFPWALVLFFLVIAFRLDRFIPKPRFIQPLLTRAQKMAIKLPRPAAGALVGSLTPLLPCAPLYAVFGLALMTQSPLRGAEFLLAFGLGTLPLLWLVQSGFSRWQGRISPVTITRIQRGIAFLAAFIIGLRLYFYETGQHGLFCG